jgi:hypothetical protein
LEVVSKKLHGFTWWVNENYLAFTYFTQFEIDLHDFTLAHSRLGIHIYTNVNDKYYMYKECK